MDFIWLVFAHYIGDVALQDQWQADNKGTKWYAMLCHTMIWTAIVCVALQFLGIYAFWKVWFLLAGHWISDRWKSRQPKTPETWHFIYYDQAWHMVQLIIVFLIK